MRQMRLAEVAANVAADALDAVAASQWVERVSTDSRDVRPGDLFWALVGERYDGHEFVGDALRAGAAAAVVSREVAGCENDAPLLRVNDTRQALGRFAAEYRRTSSATVIGITGSVGKTSTRESIYAVLGQRCAGVRSQKNFNNDVGVPLSLLQLGPNDRFAVIEMAASGTGEIARLAEMASPQIGVLTTIGPAHLEGFGSIEAVARAKTELIESLGRGGIAVLNADDERVRAIGLGAACRVVWFGTEGRVQGSGVRSQNSDPPPRAVVMGHEIEASGEAVSFRFDGGPRVTLNAAGRHQVYAALAAVAVGRLFGMADSEITTGLESYRPPPMRCQVERLGDVTVINDSYNASPQSMQAALDLLAGWPTAGRRVLACGDMKELGPQGPHLHRQLGEQIARRGRIDRCVAVGPLSEHAVREARAAGMDAEFVTHCESTQQAAGVLRRIVRRGDVVLVKASRAMRLEQMIEPLRERFARGSNGSQ